MTATCEQAARADVMDHDDRPPEQADQANVTDHDDPAPRAGRAVVSDPPGAPSMLTLYTGDHALAELQLAPAEAVALASDLLLSARRRYGRPSQEPGQL